MATTHRSPLFRQLKRTTMVSAASRDSGSKLPPDIHDEPVLTNELSELLETLEREFG